MSLALLFPGQGSQTVGMGRALAAEHAVAAETLAEADDILGFALSRLMADGPADELTATENAQPALLAHSVAVLRVLADLVGPVAVAAGHSLGEFSAHVAARTLSFRDGLEAVRVRGRLMSDAGKAQPGTMAAVIGLDDGAVEDLCARVTAGVCVPANFNAQGQVVISGDAAGVTQGVGLAKQAGAKVVPLKVSGAFHSPLMAPARDGLRARLETAELRDPVFPVVSNVTGMPVVSGTLAGELLVDQLTSPVRWSATITTMLSMGVDRFLELGPGSVLCGLNKRNARGLPCTAVGEPGQLDALRAGARVP